MDVISAAVGNLVTKHLNGSPAVFSKALQDLREGIADPKHRRAVTVASVIQLSQLVADCRRLGVVAAELTLPGPLLACFNEEHEMRTLRICYGASAVDELIEFFRLIAVTAALRKAGIKLRLYSADLPPPPPEPAATPAPQTINITLQQPAGPQKVEVVSLPARVTETEIERDGAGDIKRTTQIEVDFKNQAANANG